jgi:hypothetical protein
MKRLLLVACLIVCGCADRPRIDLTITNAPASLGNCMPTKPAGGCP